MRFSVPLLLALFLFTGCQNSEKTSADAEKFDLSFNLPDGLKKEMVYEFRVESPSNNSDLHYFMEFDFEKTGSENKETEVKITYRNIRLEGHADTLKIDLVAGKSDSTSSAMIYAEPFFSCLNHVFLLKYDNTMAKISEELLTEKDEKSLTAPVNKAQFFTSLPGKPVQVGDTWKNSVELRIGKGVTVTALYKLSEIKGDQANIEFTGDLDGSGEGFGHDFSMKGKVTGNIQVELSSGLTLSSEMVQDLILMLAEKETPMKFTIKQYIK